MISQLRLLSHILLLRGLILQQLISGNFEDWVVKKIPEEGKKGRGAKNST